MNEKLSTAYTKPKTVREWFTRIDDKLNIFKESITANNALGLETTFDDFIDTGGIYVGNCAVDLIAEIICMLNAMGIDEQEYQEELDRKIAEHG